MIIKCINKRETLRMFSGTWLTLVIVNAIPPTRAGAHGKMPAPKYLLLGEGQPGGDISSGMGGLGVTHTHPYLTAL